MIVWLAGRLGRLDWMQALAPKACTPSAMFAFALRADVGDDALTFLRDIGKNGRAAALTLSYRQLGESASPAELTALADDCRSILDGTPDLDGFSRVRITETVARCLRRCGATEEMTERWRPIDDLPLASRETRASLLAESGRDLLVSGLGLNRDEQSLRGARRLVDGWSVARLSDLNNLEAVWAAAEALGGYADARDALVASPRRDLVAQVRPILAEGARDGKWMIDAVQKSDLPDFYLTPAMAGAAFLSELKRTLPPSVGWHPAG